MNSRDLTNDHENPPDQMEIVNSDFQNAVNLGLAPSAQLRRHFVALARRVRQWAAPVKRPVKIGVTSLERGVGNSTIAFNLASALSRIDGEHVLLVESDFGKHFISRKLGRAGAAGLSDIIKSGKNPDDCIFETPIDDLSLLGSGHISEQDSVELPFDLLGPILGSHFDQFGFLVFDLPVANDLTSCYSILPYIDGVMVVVDSGKIDRKHVLHAKKRLVGCGVELIGLVINQT